ncbi:MAG: cupredoxin domain-containing protein [Acidobacteriota bacterium]|nr:cupredoxin domain-containing protein [Acidobacteriota bacterium]
MTEDIMADNTHNFPLEEPQQTTEKVRRAVGLSILGALALVLALIGIDVAVIQAAQNPPPRPIVTKKVVRVSSTAPVASTLYLSVSPGIKPGPDGKLHDAFSVNNFEVRAGQPVKLVIDNTDSSPHSITSPAAGVNIVVRPGMHTYTLLVQRSGVFQWYCNYPCDPYAMMHDGYMRGTITSV